jgi:hypothetical protein
MTTHLLAALLLAGAAELPPGAAAGPPELATTGAASAYVATPNAAPAFVPVASPTVYLRLEVGVAEGKRDSRSDGGKNTATAFIRLNVRVWQELTLAAFCEAEVLRYTPLDLGPGYDWYRLDFGLAPRFTLHPFENARRFPALEAYLSLPFGLTSVHATVPPRRAFREEIRQTGGWFAGVTAGVAYLPRSRIAGVFVELAYARHAVGLSSTVTPFDQPQAPSTSHLDAADHRFLVSIGGILSLLRW